VQELGSSVGSVFSTY